MSLTPEASIFLGRGRKPHSGIPGAPMGPPERITRTSSDVTSRLGSSMRASKSSWSSKTMARPSCVKSDSDAAVGFMSAPVGARVPVRTARPPSGFIGSSMLRMMSGL